VDFSRRDFLTKNHFSTAEHRDILLSDNHVRILNIKRDIRDVVTSAYYHYRREEGYSASFKQYYWDRGRYVAENVRAYHELWDGSSHLVYVSSYKDLKNNFSDECKRISNFIDIDISKEKIKKIRKETSLSGLQNKYKKVNFFRKGKIGGWKNHLTEDMEEDVKRIYKGGIKNMSKIGR
jgi:hypothetical protein